MGFIFIVRGWLFPEEVDVGVRLADKLVVAIGIRCATSLHLSAP